MTCCSPKRAGMSIRYPSSLVHKINEHVAVVWLRWVKTQWRPSQSRKESKLNCLLMGNWDFIYKRDGSRNSLRRVNWKWAKGDANPKNSWAWKPWHQPIWNELLLSGKMKTINSNPFEMTLMYQETLKYCKVSERKITMNECIIRYGFLIFLFYFRFWWSPLDWDVVGWISHLWCLSAPNFHTILLLP